MDMWSVIGWIVLVAVFIVTSFVPISILCYIFDINGMRTRHSRYESRQEDTGVD